MARIREEGEGFVSVDRAVTCLSKGQVITIPERIAHLYGASKDYPWSIYWFLFAGDFSPTYVSRALSRRGIKNTHAF
jgi:hypothetical protein